MRFCSLGSGSAGNALLVEASDGARTTRVLLDNGFGPRVLGQRLAARAGLALESIDAVVLTHEHSDHIGGVRALLRHHRVTVHASAGTLAHLGLPDGAGSPIVATQSFAVGALQIRAFAVPHDAAEPLQFVFSDGSRTLGVVTDLGHPAATVARALDDLNALVLECNHDAELLRTGRYPPPLKARVAGNRGHLSNDQAAELLAAVGRSRLNCVVAAHLSRANNRPELARAALAAVMGTGEDEIEVADQDAGLDWRSV